MIRTTTTTLLAWLALTALLLVALAPPAAAQRRIMSDGPEMGRGFLQAGYMRLDLDELNSSLSAAGLPTLDDTFLTLGGAGYANRGRFLFGGEGHGVLGSEETTVDGARRLETSGGYGLVRVGYLVFERAGMDIFPLVGIGGGGMSLEIAERSAPTFEDVLEVPERSSSLSTGAFLLDVSLAANYRVLVEDTDEGEAGGLLLGLQAGYTFTPGDTSWDLDGINSVAGGPELQIEGPYLRLSVGGWGRSEDGDDD